MAVELRLREGKSQSSVFCYVGTMYWIYIFGAKATNETVELTSIVSKAIGSLMIV